MKKIYLFFISALFACSLNAQIYSEDFEGLQVGDIRLVELGDMGHIEPATVHVVGGDLVQLAAPGASLRGWLHPARPLLALHDPHGAGR